MKPTSEDFDHLAQQFDFASNKLDEAMATAAGMEVALPQHVYYAQPLLRKLPEVLRYAGGLWLAGDGVTARGLPGTPSLWASHGLYPREDLDPNPEEQQ